MSYQYFISDKISHLSQQNQYFHLKKGKIYDYMIWVCFSVNIFAQIFA